MSEDIVLPSFHTERLIVETPTIADAQRVRDFYDRNREYFQKWEPDHGAQIFTLEFWQQVLPTYADEYQRGQAVTLYANDGRGADVMLVRLQSRSRL